MTNILETIIERKRTEVADRKRLVPESELDRQVRHIAPRPSFASALRNSRAGIIAEFKRRSPSKNWINQFAQVGEIVPAYEQAGATAISVLTDSDFFGGSPDDLIEAADMVKIPLLRKDFTIGTYQIYEAKLWGASAVLLIAAALPISLCKELTVCAKSLNLDVLLEIHSADELSYISPLVDVVGINNRNLKTFVTDTDVSVQLGKMIPSWAVKISESGISSPETVKQLQNAGFQGFLMGENFMKTEYPGETLRQFIGQLTDK